MSSSICGRLRDMFLHESTSSSMAALTSPHDKNIQDLINLLTRTSRAAKFRPHLSQYKATVTRLVKAGRLSSIHDVLDHQKQHPTIRNERFTALLIGIYGEAKMLDHARRLFDEMPDLYCQRTLVSFNALLAACLPSRDFGKVVELFRELPGKLSVKPDVISYTTVIKALCEMGSLDEAVSMFEEMAGNDVEPNVITFDVLLSAFYGSGRLCEAEKMWKLMEEKKINPTLRCYQAKLLGMVNEKRIDQAMEVFEGLDEKGLKPDTYTYNLMIKLFVNECNMEEVKKWYMLMLDSDCAPNFVTFMTLVIFACGKKDIDFAYELCKKSFVLKCKVSRKMMKMVIGELVEQSRIEEANELLELDNSRVS